MLLSKSLKLVAFQSALLPGTASSPGNAMYKTSVFECELFPLTFFPKQAVPSDMLASPISGGPSSPLVSPQTP
jgi:hypothetical protein